MNLPRLLSALASLTLLAAAARAQTNATWTGATNSNWNFSGTNWTPMNIPGGTSNDTATFNAASGSNNITSTGFSLASLTFTSDALANTITASGSMNFFGAGIVNASAATQTLVANSSLAFNNSSAAGSVAITSNFTINFVGFSSAGSATITNNGTASFSGSATAGSASITNNSSLSFLFNATAGSAAITNNDTVSFSINASGGSAAVTNGASGIVDFTNSSFFSSQSLGSLAGGGTVLMPYGGTLTVGSLNTNTTFSGVLDDANTGSNLTKVGSGTLTLTGANTYIGGTTVAAGTLSVNGSLADSIVTVATGGTLSGSGTFGGATTVQSGGTLAPGNSPGLATFSSGLTLDSGSSTNFEINGPGRGTTYDAIDVTGGTLTYGGTFNLSFGSLLANGTTLDLFGLTNPPAATFFSSIVATGSYAGSFTNSGGDWTFTDGTQVLTFSQSTGDLSFAASAVPEPSTYAALLGAAALVGVAVQRQRKKISVNL
ncbi:MAG: autotransporter-associated beta strand repeat-containing protein [Opitutae bacterium]|nr:autotransporter-associated beta strand repeat-containing protein [Opitutae bacterium]